MTVEWSEIFTSTITPPNWWKRRLELSELNQYGLIKYIYHHVYIQSMFTWSMRSRVPLSCLLKKNDLELDSDPTTRAHSFPVVDSGQKGKHCNTHNCTVNTHTVQCVHTAAFDKRLIQLWPQWRRCSATCCWNHCYFAPLQPPAQTKTYWPACRRDSW